jgi:hypothetical protein
MTGKLLRNTAEHHPLREAYRLYNNLANRQSWDQATVLLAGPSGNGLPNDSLNISEQGRVQIDENGNNTWEALKDGPHRFVIATTKTKDLARTIDELMQSATEHTP